MVVMKLNVDGGMRQSRYDEKGSVLELFSKSIGIMDSTVAEILVIG